MHHSMVIKLLGFALFAIALALPVSAFLLKRPDVSCRKLLLAGPIVVLLRPREYFRVGVHKVPVLLFCAGMLCAAALWVASWVRDNP